MRRAAIFAPLLLLGGCHREPDFGERYDKAAKEIEARTKAMDADMPATAAPAKRPGQPPAAKKEATKSPAG